MTNLEICQQVLGTMVDKIKTDQQAKDITASGASAETLGVVMQPDGGDITGARYFYQQIHGRRPGKFPPIQNIIEWIETKGIEADIPVKSLAFLIARKIAREGTNIFQGKSPGLALSAIVQEGSAQVASDIAANTREEVLNVFRILKQTK